MKLADIQALTDSPVSVHEYLGYQPTIMLQAWFWILPPSSMRDHICEELCMRQPNYIPPIPSGRTHREALERMA